MKVLMCIHHPIISPIKCLCSPSKAFEGAKIFTQSFTETRRCFLCIHSRYWDISVNVLLRYLRRPSFMGTLSLWESQVSSRIVSFIPIVGLSKYPEIVMKRLILQRASVMQDQLLGSILRCLGPKFDQSVFSEVTLSYGVTSFDCSVLVQKTSSAGANLAC